MFKNYIKIAFRNLWKNKGYSAINIFGLAIGLAICLLITLFVLDELSYDKFNLKADRIYRIDADFLVNGGHFNERTVPARLGEVLVKDYPQIENSVRIIGTHDFLVKKGTETVIEPNGCYADASLFDVFTLPLLAGNPKTALLQPNALVISESVARKYFGSIDVIGKTLHLDNTADYEITGVIKDMPAQSHIHFSLIKAMSGYPPSKDANWMTDNFVTYILARPGITEQQINSYLKVETKKYMETSLKQMTGSTISDLEQKGEYFRYLAIPITKIHLYSKLTSEAELSGNIQYVYIFMIVSVFILLIACVNSMNLATARSAGRSKEVGVRKVLGSKRSDLIFQFLTESMLTSLLSLIVAVFIACLLLPLLNQLSSKNIGIHLFSGQWLIFPLLFVALVVGFLAGIYPAFYLSAFEPIKVLKGRLAVGFRGSWLRNTLVVFQFTTAILLIVGTILIYQQLNFIQNKNLGYDREQILLIKNTLSLSKEAPIFKAEVLKLPGVVSGTMAGSLPTTMEYNTTIYSKDAAQSVGQVIGIPEFDIDADYIPTFGMKMAKGRNFLSAMPTDSSMILLNETAANILGFKNPIDKNLYTSYNGARYQVIGVVKDFNTGSLRSKIPPVVFRLSKNPSYMAFRVKTKNLSSLIEQIEYNYHTVVSNMAGQPFGYTFMDEDFNRIYQSEQQTGKLFILFAFLTILIACLGLFGLITFAAEQRTREIGIRKVLGATVANITGLLSADFIKLVFLAILIATPIAWFAIHKWLQGFAYHTNISWWVFVLAGILALTIALATISFQAIKAALANPVKSLRSE